MAMAFGRTLVSKTQLSTFLYRSFTTSLTTTNRSLTSTLLRFRPLVVLAEFRGTPSLTVGTRSFATRPTTSSLNDPSPNFSNRPPKETILLDGCDFEHWLVVLEKPPEEWTRDEIIDYYIKTLAQIVGSEEEARMKIYSVSTRCYFAFGALVSEEMSEKLKALEKVRWVLPDSYLDVRNKDYGGEPFINGQAVPYDPKYHEEWIKNNARANERSRRNDRPRNNDRSRNFERRRENQQSRDFQSPMPNRSIEGPPGAPAMVGAPGAPPNGGMPPRGNFQNTNMPPNPNAPNSPQYMGGGQPHPNMQYNAPNPTMQYNAPNPNNQFNAPNSNPNPNPNNQYNAPNPNNQYNAPNPNMQYNPPNMGGMPPRNTGYPNNAPHAGNMLNQDYQHAPNGGGAPYQSREAPGAMPNRGFQNNDYAPGGNMGGPPSGNRGFQNNDYAPGGNMGGPPSGNQ